jgi:AraC family transcriptional regulator of adaptative response/methylated-DNA-[protein]-cysteine methyltransferase
MIKEAEDAPALAQLAAQAGYSPAHFRLFTRHTGLSPAAYARALRQRRMGDALAGGGVTEAIHAAGYGAPSRFYAKATGWAWRLRPGAMAGRA